MTRRQKMVRVLLLGAYGALLVLVMAVTAYLSFSKFVRRGSISTPNLEGLNLSAATDQLERAGLRLRHLAEEDRFDESVPSGKVVQQAPVSGSFVKQGGQIEVILSRGRQLVTVPDLAGQEFQAAQTELASAGLVVGRRGHVSWSGAAVGAVVYQSPGAGELADQGSTVDLLLSLGDPAGTFVMPDLVYRRAEEVRRHFERRGFRFGSVKYEPYEGVEEGTVLRHTPLAGHPLRRHEVITLVVATSLDS